VLRNVPFPAVLSAGLIFNLAVGPTALTAQQVSADVPSITIRSYTRLVVVDVVVTDKKSQPVTGLKAEDFIIEENGKKQKIAVFNESKRNQAGCRSGCRRRQGFLCDWLLSRE